MTEAFKEEVRKQLDKDLGEKIREFMIDVQDDYFQNWAPDSTKVSNEDILNLSKNLFNDFIYEIDGEEIYSVE